MSFPVYGEILKVKLDRDFSTSLRFAQNDIKFVI